MNFKNSKSGGWQSIYEYHAFVHALSTAILPDAGLQCFQYRNEFLFFGFYQCVNSDESLIIPTLEQNSIFVKGC